MSLTLQEENFVQELTSISRDLISQQKYIKELIARWNQNDFFNLITDNDLETSSKFAHLSKAEVANVITAITAVDNALGDYISGQAVNLLKIVG